MGAAEAGEGGGEEAGRRLQKMLLPLLTVLAPSPKGESFAAKRQWQRQQLNPLTEAERERERGARGGGVAAWRNFNNSQVQ